MGDTNIFIAAGDGDLAAVQQFVAQGVDVNVGDDHGYTACHAAASYGNEDVLRYLLSVGARVDVRDEDGDTPLHACETAACAKLLATAGADVAAVNSEGQTPYHVAVLEHRDEMTKWLEETYSARGMELPHVEPEVDEEDADGMPEEDEDEDAQPEA